MKFACFVTGADTEIGKTCITLGLMQAFKGRGLSVAGMKPVASGGTLLHGKLVNDDATKIHASCSKQVPYELINPYIMEEPIAPHIAAKKKGKTIELETIVEAYETLSAQNDVVIVEGVGGWRVPLSEGLQTADLVKVLSLPVILVVGLRLGCINHALLSAETIVSDGLGFFGWVANNIDPTYSETEATIGTLSPKLPARFLGNVPYAEPVSAVDVANAFKQDVFN